MEQIATVVSIVPCDLKLDIMGIHPGNFFIPKADEDDPKVLHIGNSWHMIYLGADRDSLKVTDLSYDIARSIVEDFKRSVICVEPGCEPGLFWVPRMVSENDVKLHLFNELQDASVMQTAWYLKLIKMADDDWTKSGHLHRSISDLQRWIAKKLQMEKEWLYVPKNDPSLNKCPACRNVVDKESIICGHCKLILQPDKYKEMEFATV
jgi:hypothetical protein